MHQKKPEPHHCDPGWDMLRSERKQVNTASLRLGSLEDCEPVLSGYYCEASPCSMELAHAVDMFNDSRPAHIGVVVGIVEPGDFDGVPDLDTVISVIVAHGIVGFCSVCR